MSAPEPVPIANEPWVERSWRRDIVVAIVTVMTGFFLAWLSEQLPQKEMAKRGLTRALIPLLAPLYAAPTSSRITIVTVDDQDIALADQDWPLELPFLTGQLSRILEKTPRVLFIDLLLKKKASPEEIKGLLEVLCNARGITKIYVASIGDSLPYSETEKKIFAPLNQATSDGASALVEPACATPVNVQLTSDEHDHSQWTYPIEIESNTKSGKPQKSAAFQIFCDEQHCDDEDKPPDLAIVWPASSALTNVQTMIMENKSSHGYGELPYASICSDGIRAAAVAYAFLPKFGNKELNACPYHQIIPLRAFENIGFSEGELTAALANKIVIFGADIIGATDVVHSPINGALPGVHAHAIALDNMLFFNGLYKESGHIELTDPFTRGNVFALISILGVVVTITLWRHYYTEPEVLTATHRTKKIQPWRRRLAQVMMAVLLPFMLVLGRPYGNTTINRRIGFLSKTTFITINIVFVACIFLIGYVWLRQGPLSMAEYVVFPFLAHFLHIGERVSKRGFAWYAAIGKPDPWAAWAEASRKAKKAEH